MSALTHTQLATLHTQLVVPVAVTDILHHSMEIDGEMQYGLHESLSEMDPDAALLAIAICAQHIAAPYIREIPVAGALGLEAEKIVEDYAPDWLHHADGQPVDEEQIYFTLQYIPEDLEAMADLLDTLRSSLWDQEGPAKMLCEILSIQARAHMEIADYVLKEIEMGGPAQPIEAAPVSHGGDNIILFPAHLVRQS